jgi:hypothetical protein
MAQTHLSVFSPDPRKLKLFRFRADNRNENEALSWVSGVQCPIFDPFIDMPGKFTTREMISIYIKGGVGKCLRT